MNSTSSSQHSPYCMMALPEVPVVRVDEHPAVTRLGQLVGRADVDRQHGSRRGLVGRDDDSFARPAGDSCEAPEREPRNDEQRQRRDRSILPVSRVAPVRRHRHEVRVTA